jgi:hypothetical protein
MIRMLGFLVATIAYGGVWLAVALLFSVVFRAPATAALAALGVWLLFALFWSVVTPLVATLIAGPPEGIFGPNIAYLQTSQTLDRISPNTLYAEIALALLQPATRALGPVLYSQVRALCSALPKAARALSGRLADRAHRDDDRDLRDRLLVFNARRSGRNGRTKRGGHGPPWRGLRAALPLIGPPTSRPGQVHRQPHEGFIAANDPRKRRNRCPQTHP